jgi:replicative DNA helicase
MATNKQQAGDDTPIKSIPSSLEAERAVLGSILIDPDAIVKLVAVRLKPEHFFRERNAWIYDAMLHLHQQNKPIDFLTVMDQLEATGQLHEIGGPAYLTGLINATPSSLNADYYGKRLVALAMRRDIIAFAGDLAQWAYEDDGADDPSVLANHVTDMALERFAADRDTDLEHIKDITARVVDQIDYMTRNPHEILGVPTGYTLLDRTLGGLPNGDVVILAARPAMGKTALANNIMLNAAQKYGSRIALFSLEMTPEQISQRLLAIMSGIDSHRLRMAQVQDDEWYILLETANALAQTEIYVDGSTNASIGDIRAKCKRLDERLRRTAMLDPSRQRPLDQLGGRIRGLDLVIVDYLQLIELASTRAQNREQELAYISRSLKRLAVELNVPVLALSQLSRAVEERASKRVQLADMRGSGAIEQDAAIVLGMYREDYYDADTDRQNIVDLDILKNRHGSTGTVSLYFRKELTQFRDLEIMRTELDY